MTVPRLFSPFVRTRTRLACTLGLLPAVLIAASVPWWPHEDTDARPAPVAGPAAVAGVKDEAVVMAEAVAGGKNVLIDKLTTTTSLTWARPDGQLETTINAVPVRARNTAGSWAPIDNTLAAQDGPLGIRPANPVTPVRFSGGGDPGAAETVLAETEADGHTLTYTWPGALPAPVLDGSRALYPEVRPGVDLLLVARREGGFSNALIVKNREAATAPSLGTLSYKLSSPTAIFRHDAETGGVRVLDATSQAEIGSVPTPLAWDSSGKDPESPEAARTAVATSADVLALSGLGGLEPGSRQAPMPTRLDGDGTGSAELHLDVAATGLLTDPAATFPLFLDPTMISDTLAWALVHKPNANSNFLNGVGFNGKTPDARVGYESDTKGLARSFWRMGFDKTIKGAEISSASFKVLNNHSWSCTDREFQLWQTGAISSGTTWNKQPSWIALQQKLSFANGYSASACANAYVSFNVKDGAQAAADAGASNLTLGMRATSESDTQTWRKFEADTAELKAVYNRKPKEPTGGTTSPGGECEPGPGNGVTIAKTTIVLSASATDPDGNLSKLRFRWWKTGGTVSDGTLVTPNSAGKATLTIPSTSLVDKGVYSWDVRAEDSGGLVSTFFPGGTTEPCRFIIDASAPAAPIVESVVFPAATADGATWATVKFGGTGAVTFTADGAVKFAYAFEYIDSTTITATSGKATVTALKPRHAGPTTLVVYAYDAAGNRSAATLYTFYVPPRDIGDGPYDTGGDGIADLLLVNESGNLRTLSGDTDGELYTSLAAAYVTGGKINPAGQWYDAATGRSALIAHHSDVYPGDGITDLFARTPDGGFYLYPGDGYGSFNVDQRLKVLLPSNTPDPATWTQLKAVGDITGDGKQDLAIRTATAFWVLSGYTGGSFQEATAMATTVWERRGIVTITDVDVDGTPDLLWRNLDTGTLYLRHGLPGAVAGSVSLDSLKSAAASRAGDVTYGTGWQEPAVKEIISIPDASGDGIPELWEVSAVDGQVRLYYPSKTATGPVVKTVLSVDWRLIKAFG
ncbi:DNRLRE domain-containing protein [Actinoplanes sp. NPDC051494]|uniref:DNRLRE domain-containing protein n=1 Tax=Actinoplanes sp. NPDC051494 TaxID=3363907 RepID=UPI00378E8DAC